MRRPARRVVVRPDRLEARLVPLVTAARVVVVVVVVAVMVVARRETADRVRRAEIVMTGIGRRARR